jgi:hypothetical protein
MQQIIDMTSFQSLTSGLTQISNFNPQSPVAPGTDVDLSYTVTNITDVVTPPQTLKVFGYILNTDTQQQEDYWEQDNVLLGGYVNRSYHKTINDTFNGEVVCGHYESESPPSISWPLIAVAVVAAGVVIFVIYKGRKKHG